MPTPPKIHHVSKLELVDIEHTPEVGVQVLVQGDHSKLLEIET